MSYKMIDHLAKACGRVRGAALTHRGVICDDIAERYRHKMAPGQKYPDIFELFTWIGDDLERYHTEVVEAETQLMRHLTAEVRERLERDSSVSSIREHLFAARDIFDAIYGPTGNDIIFMRQNSYVFTDAVPLYRQAVRVHDNLLDPHFQRPKLRRDLGVKVKKIAWDMEPDLEVLEERMRDLHLQDAVQSLEVKENRMVDLEVWVGRDVRLLEAFAHFSDHPGIATRIRRSSHRKSAAADDGTGAGDGAPLEAGEPAAESTAPENGAADPTAAEQGATAPAPDDAPASTPGAPAADSDEAAAASSSPIGTLPALPLPPLPPADGGDAGR